jgi:peptide-methionine (S)-S-oxide reductase
MPAGAVRALAGRLPPVLPLLLVAALGMPAAHGDERAVRVPAPLVDEPAGATHAPQTAVFAGGCFWGVQVVFQHVQGVQRVVSGYAGGTPDTADYETVSSGRTGHAESVQITFDPAVVSYGTLLRVFFSVAHDPTQVDRQGPDYGTQYRSAIFTRGDAQRRIAQAYVRQLDQAGVFPEKIATRIDPLQGFYAAEAYHQDFATRHPDDSYVARNDLPKVKNLERLFPQLYRREPALVAATQ